MLVTGIGGNINNSDEALVGLFIDLYEKSGNLLPSILFHSAVNAAYGALPVIGYFLGVGCPAIMR